MTEDDVRELLRKACDEHGCQNKFAKQAGISAQYVADFLRERRGPGAALLRALGVVKVVSYEREANPDGLECSSYPPKTFTSTSRSTTPD